MVVFGELGLTGEVRNISFLEKRITEAHKLGFKKCVIPYTQNNIFIEGLEIIKVKNIIEAFGAIF